MIGWNVTHLDYEELQSAIVAGFCLLNGLDRANLRVRIRLVCDPGDAFTPTRFFAEVHTQEEKP